MPSREQRRSAPLRSTRSISPMLLLFFLGAGATALAGAGARLVGARTRFARAARLLVAGA